ncbi:MAG TPA: hypothetical protein VHV10_02770 [Ktedonobacteraceae bacterium]|jgi:hypothetical protein|nr:hypothetical protein [Ktedonobacteraceae bacterium]
MGVTDLYNRIGVVPDLNPAAKTATTNSTGIDRTLYEGGSDALVGVLVVGAWTDGSHTFKLQDSPDNSVWTDVAAPYLQGSFTAITSAGQQNAVQKVGYLGYQRYVRAVDTVSGATTGAIYGFLWIVGSGHNLPTGSPN